MKMRLMALLFLVLSLSLCVGQPFLLVAPVSSITPSSNLAASQDPVSGQTTQNSAKNITINGNLVVSGNDVVVFAGSSSTSPANIFLNGNIDVTGNGTLVLRYVNLFIVGAQSPYQRYIRLSNASNGHPRLNILDSIIDSYAVVTQTRNGPRGQSYGIAISAYDNSEIIGNGLNFSRLIVPAPTTLNPDLPFLYGQTVISAYNESSVNIVNCLVDLVQAYDNSSVSIHTGSGPNRLKVKSGGADSGIGFELYNNSVTDVTSVTFKNITISGRAHLFLRNCMGNVYSQLIATGQSRVECSDGTSLITTLGKVVYVLKNGTVLQKPPRNVTFTSVQQYFVALNVSGDSYVSINASRVNGLFSYYPAADLYENATLVVFQDSGVTGGVYAFGNSTVVLKDSNLVSGLTNIDIESYGNSHISISNCTLFASPSPPIIDLFNFSRLSLSNSLINTGLLSLYNSTVAYCSHSTLYECRAVTSGMAQFTLVNGSSVSDTLETTENSSLTVESSTLAVLYCHDSTQVSLVNASAAELRLGGTAKAATTNSTIEELSLSGSNVTASFAGLTDFFGNSTFALSANGSQIRFIATYVKGLDFSLSDHSNVTFSNSTIRNISLQGSSVVTLNNATITGLAYASDNSTVYEYSPLRVRVVDYFGNPVSGTNVTVGTGILGTQVIERQTADKDGYATFLIYSESINATGLFPLGPVTVTGRFGNTLNYQTANIGLVNKGVTLSMSLPDWTKFILPLIVVVVIIVLLIIGYVLNKALERRRARSS